MHTARRMALAGSSGSTNMDISVNDCLSRLNHRLYRQGYHYRAKVEIEPSVTTSVDVYALAPTWWLCKAYKYARAKYNKSISAESKALGRKMKGRWHDFRVDSGTTGTNLRPALLEGQNLVQFAAGSFPQARLGLNNGNSKTFTWGTASTGAWSIIEEFDATYNVDQSPVNLVNMGTEISQPYGEIDGDGGLNPTDFMEVQSNGDEAPYNMTAIPSAVWVKIATLDGNAGSSGRQSTGYFDVPFGIIHLQASSGLGDGELMLEVQKGEYQGVYGVKC